MPPFWTKRKGKQPNKDTKVHLSAEPGCPTVPNESVPDLEPAPNCELDTEPKPLQGRLWNEAYEQLKSNNTELVESYEKILSTQLFRGQNGPSESASLENRIDKAYVERWKQMQMIVEAALEKKKQSIEKKQKIGNGLAAVSITMSQAVRAVPEAAVAWTGMVSNSIQEAKANNEGIVYVVSRMDWYWHLAELLSDGNITKSAPISLRIQMEKHIIDLYQKLLLYQMKSVCRYYRRHGPVIWRDAIKADNWTGQLDDIRNAEATVQKDSGIFNALEIQRRLGELDSASQVLRGEIQDISPTIKHHILSKKEERCLKDLRVTDPRDDKSRIEDTNGGLLQGAYDWAIKHGDFIAWRDEKADHMLWIKGDPGKGKTMLLCGIIDELQRQNINPCYFFCQASDPRLNSATAVLRGLIYLLVDTNRQLLSHIQEKYDQAGATLFQDANSWVVLSQMFTELLKDPSLEGQVFMIDALDECQEDLERLLDLIVNRAIGSRAKWIVSSRNWTGIEEKLGTISQNIRFSLELNEQSVSEAVNHYITHKTAQLKEAKRLDEETELVVRNYLTDNARGTFLWVALVCKELLKIAVRRRHVLKKMAEFPPDLGPLYERMMQQIRASEDSDLCERILRLVSVLYRPITLTELASLLDVENKFDREDLEETVASCGSFLVVRDDFVRFVHQSAQDFLLKDSIFVSGLGSQHYTVFLRSLDILSVTLRRDMYNLRHPGALIEEYTPNQAKDVLRHAKYSCVYWVDHLQAVNGLEREKCMLSLRDNGIVHHFLKEKLLNWLEAFSLMKKMRDAARVVRILKTLLAPLQVYSSALSFSPSSSMIRRMYEETEGSKWIITKPKMQVKWAKRVQSLEESKSLCLSLEFSPDGAQIASANHDREVRIWDMETGVCLHTMKCLEDIKLLAFSPNGKHLATVSYPLIEIWDLSTSRRLFKFDSKAYMYISSLAFSFDGTQFAAGYIDENIGTFIRTWDLGTGIELKTSKLGTDMAVCRRTAFAPDGTHSASASNDMIHVFDTSTGVCVQKIGQLGKLEELKFLATHTRLVTKSSSGDLRIWDSVTGECLWRFSIDWRWISAVSSDGMLAVSGFSELAIASSYFGERCAIRIHDPATGNCLKQFEHTQESRIESMVFFPDGKRLVSIGRKTIEVWNVSSGMSLQSIDLRGSDLPVAVVFSPDGTQLGLTLASGAVLIFDVQTGACLQDVDNFFEPLIHEGMWIMRGKERVLWLPLEYRPSIVEVYDGFVTCLTDHGGFSYFQFAIDELDKVLA
ncbi:hypothetical protein CI102_4876 [Trichoderma harzianum]|nr:hypothetical protein CI102_4876 [Trichoderma harzianum]